MRKTKPMTARMIQRMAVRKIHRLDGRAEDEAHEGAEDPSDGCAGEEAREDAKDSADSQAGYRRVTRWVKRRMTRQVKRQVVRRVTWWMTRRVARQFSCGWMRKSLAGGRFARPEADSRRFSGGWMR